MTNTRPRGYAPWRPQAKTLAFLDQIEGVLAEYRAHWPLTIRQVYYRLTMVHRYPKTDKAYKALCETFNRARRAGLVPWEAIRDDGAANHEAVIDRPWREYLDDLTDPYLAELWTPDLWVDQPCRVEVWCEAAGMVPQLAGAVEDYQVPVRSGGGFSSVTALREAAVRIARQDMPTVILHVGDHDPSGVHVFKSAAEDVTAFVEAEGGVVEFRRIAVLPEHITEYGLPTAPPKKGDKRAFSGETVQAEALPPNVLSRLVVESVRGLVDLNVWADRQGEVQADRDALREALEDVQ